MSRKPHPSAQCRHCAKAHAFIEAVAAQTPEEFDQQFFLDGLPLLFEGALVYLLADFDYEANLTSDTAIAARLMALGARRLRQIPAVTVR